MLRCSGPVLCVCLALAILQPGPARKAHAQNSSGIAGSALSEPADPKARKTFESAIRWEKDNRPAVAYDSFLKANKQSGGQCTACLDHAYKMALEMDDEKKAENVLRAWIPLAGNDRDRSTLHFNLGVALQREGIAGKKDDCLSESCNEFKTALTLDPQQASAIYGMGVSLARLHQDDAARAEFADYLSLHAGPPDLLQRAALYVKNVELARARMAPPFEVTTLDGQRISLDDFEGKVVLIDFWATWCGPCREALPHIREIARRFKGQPLVVLSVSLDTDEKKWKDFVTKNEMTWLQYRDGGFNGPLAARFGVQAIPATFTIDADGVLEDQHVGDANIEDKLKKLIARAVEAQNEKAAPAAAPKTAGSGN
jgi:thiol-disulfide isomerase/thioredoxin